MLSSTLPSPLPPSFLDTYSLCTSSLGCKPYALSLLFSCSLVHLLKFFSLPLQEWSRIYYEEDNPGVYPFDEISALWFGFKEFSRAPEIFFLKCFLSSLLVWWCPLPIFPIKFPFFWVFWFFCSWFGSSIPFVNCLFPLFIISMAHFLCRIPSQYPDCILLLLLFTLLEFFTSVLADGFSLEFKWQQVSSSLQDSSQDSGCSQQCCHLDNLYPSANFQVLQTF